METESEKKSNLTSALKSISVAERKLNEIVLAGEEFLTAQGFWAYAQTSTEMPCLTGKRAEISRWNLPDSILANEQNFFAENALQCVHLPKDIVQRYVSERREEWHIW